MRLYNVGVDGAAGRVVARTSSTGFAWSSLCKRFSSTRCKRFASSKRDDGTIGPCGVGVSGEMGISRR
jgi:hypothetical protein